MSATPELATPLIEAVRQWIADDPEPRDATELQDLLDKAQGGDLDATRELTDRFAGTLQFGTAGLRGALGAGPNRMNRAVVIRAAAGLMGYLNDVVTLPVGFGRIGIGLRIPFTDGILASPVVVIGFDARHGSAQFAADTAAVVAGAGGRALLLPGPLPTPVLAFAVRHLSADAGVMVTASHNPPQDNGYKVYLGGRAAQPEGRGVQIVPPADAQIAAHIDAVPSVRSVPRTGGDVQHLGEEIVHDYLDRVLAAGGGMHDGGAEVGIVLTSMHGVGGQVAEAALARAGFTNVTVVAQQAEPDPDFPTVQFPNPEEPGALDLAFATAADVGADLIIANDPDADRCSVAIPDAESASGWRQLTGDEIGALLGEQAARAHVAQAGEREGGVLASSIVSSRVLGPIAAAYGLAHVPTLTGFKWIARVPDLVFGYEEAIGYCVDPLGVRDKDGISAAVAFARLAADVKTRGHSIADALDGQARTYGLHATAPLSVRVSDLTLIPAAMQRLRQAPPSSLAGSAVTLVTDLADGSDDLPPTDGLVYLTEAGDRVIVRPSGTEPKVKCYLEVILDPGEQDLAQVRTAAAQRLAVLSTDIAEAAGL